MTNLTENCGISSSPLGDHNIHHALRDCVALLLVEEYLSPRESLFRINHRSLKECEFKRKWELQVLGKILDVQYAWYRCHQCLPCNSDRAMETEPSDEKLHLLDSCM